MKAPLEIREIAPERTSGDFDHFSSRELGMLEALFSSIPGRAVFLDPDYHYRFANQEFLDFLGLPEEDVIGRHVQDVLGAAVFQSYLPILDRLSTGEKIRWEGWADYGELGRRFVQEAISPFLPDPDGPARGFIAIARDLTDLKQREQELADQIDLQRATEASHVAIVDTALDGIVVMDEQGLIVDFNPAAEAIFGYRRKEALGQSVADMLIPAEHRDAHNTGLRAHLASGTSNILGKRLELSAMLSDRTEIPVELAITEVGTPGRRLFAAHIRDLSAAKKAEAEIREQRNSLYQKEKLAALGSLLAAVAHELNNPLSIVAGQTMMLRDDVSELALAERDGLLGRCDRISNAANRCARIVRSFLAMARQREAERTATRLEEVVAEAVELLGYTMRTSGITVDIDIASDLPELMLDANQIHQVLLNLLVNAQQALEESNRPDRNISLRVSLEGNPTFVCLIVADNGPGIPKAIRDRIFDPFFTTKPQGAGTGIGLAVSRGLIEAHGGTMDLSDAEDGGASFTIRLPFEPAVAEVAPQVNSQLPSSLDRSVRQRLLIVDDEPEIAELIAEMGRRLGFDTNTANSGKEAKAIVEAQAGRFAAILCDIRMPDGDGPSFYDWLREHHAQLSSRIGFITGDTLGPAAGRFLARSGCPMIEKPFTVQDISDFLENLIRPAGTLHT